MSAKASGQEMAQASGVESANGAKTKNTEAHNKMTVAEMQSIMQALRRCEKKGKGKDKARWRTPQRQA